MKEEAKRNTRIWAKARRKMEVGVNGLVVGQEDVMWGAMEGGLRALLPLGVWCVAAERAAFIMGP